MSDTPRTDAETYDIEVSRGDCWLEKNACSNGDGDNVSSDFARQLERELAASRIVAESNGKLAHDLSIRLSTFTTLVGTIRRWLDLPVLNVGDISPEEHSHEIGNALAAITKAKGEPS